MDQFISAISEESAVVVVVVAAACSHDASSSVKLIGYRLTPSSRRQKETEEGESAVRRDAEGRSKPHRDKAQWSGRRFLLECAG